MDHALSRASGRNRSPAMTARDKTDDELMAAFGRGDANAFDVLYTRHRDAVYGYLYRNSRDEVVCAEMFQDVWVKVIASVPRYEPRGRFRPWLFTMAHNRLVDYYRQFEQEAKGEAFDDSHSIDQSADPLREAREEETLDRIEHVLAGMPFEQRQVFFLREESGLAIRDIAEVQGIGVEAAKSRLRYAYARLREGLGDDQR